MFQIISLKPPPSEILVKSQQVMHNGFSYKLYLFICNCLNNFAGVLLGVSRNSEKGILIKTLTDIWVPNTTLHFVLDCG